MFYFPSSDILKCSSPNTTAEARWAVQHPSAAHRLWSYCCNYKSPVKWRSQWSDLAVTEQFTALRSVLMVPTLKENGLLKAERKIVFYLNLSAQRKKESMIFYNRSPLDMTLVHSAQTYWTFLSYTLVPFDTVWWRLCRHDIWPVCVKEGYINKVMELILS